LPAGREHRNSHKRGTILLEARFGGVFNDIYPPALPIPRPDAASRLSHGFTALRFITTVH